MARKLPALLSASEDGSAKAWLISEEEAAGRRQLRGFVVSTAFHPGYCYCAAWLRNPVKLTGLSSSAASVQFSMSGDAAAARALSEALEREALQLSSLVVTGCYDHAVRVWRVCDPVGVAAGVGVCFSVYSLGSSVASGVGMCA